jgi:hypothetical protein
MILWIARIVLKIYFLFFAFAGKHGDETGATTDDDDDGGFGAHRKAASVSPQRRMDPRGGYAQDTDTKFVGPEAYAEPPSPGFTGPQHLLMKKFPLRSNKTTGNEDAKENGNDSGTKASVFGEKFKKTTNPAASTIKGEDSVVIQPDVIRKAAQQPQVPNFMLGSAVTSNNTANPLIHPPKPARTSLPFGRPSLSQNNNVSPKPARIEGLSRFQKKVILADENEESENNKAVMRGSAERIASTSSPEEPVPASIVRQARSFRQTGSNKAHEMAEKRLSCQPVGELESRLQLRKIPPASSEKLNVEQGGENPKLPFSQSSSSEL